MRAGAYFYAMKAHPISGHGSLAAGRLRHASTDGAAVSNVRSQREGGSNERDRPGRGPPLSVRAPTNPLPPSTTKPLAASRFLQAIPPTHPLTSSPPKPTVMPKQASIPTKEDKTIRRSHLSPDALVTQPNLGADHDIQTVYDGGACPLAMLPYPFPLPPPPAFPADNGDVSPSVFPTLAKRHGDKHAAGYRDVVAVVEEEKEVSKIVEGKEVKEKKTWK